MKLEKLAHFQFQSALTFLLSEVIISEFCSENNQHSSKPIVEFE